jgi:hypothetical protein
MLNGYSFFLSEFLLEGFLHKVLMRQYVHAINECDVLFSSRTIFSIGFSDGVFNEVCAYCGNRPRGSVD